MNKNFPLDRADEALASFYELLESNATIEDALGVSVRTFPAYAALLVDAAASKAMTTPIINDLSTVAIFNTVAQRVANQYRPKALVSISAAIKECGLTIEDACRRLQIGRSIIRKLDQRMIELNSIPVLFLTMLSDLISEPIDRITERLINLPAISKNSAGVGPPKPTSQSFESALNTCIQTDKLEQSSLDYWMCCLNSRDDSKGP